MRCSSLRPCILLLADVITILASYVPRRSNIGRASGIHSWRVREGLREELVGICPKEHFIALQPSRGRLGTPPQKPWLASMELCCKRLGLNAMPGYSVSLPKNSCSYGIEGTVAVYRSDSDYFTLKTAKRTRDHTQSGYYCQRHCRTV